VGKVIYLTGAPATGKSTLSAAVEKDVPGLIWYSYSKLLRDIINRHASEKINETTVRQKSGTVITRADIEATDEWLIAQVTAQRQNNHIVIDSHPVTKERYGFRVTPFTPTQLKKLNPDIIVCTYSDVDVLANRIRQDPVGRPLPSDFDIALHVQLQASLATQYGFLLECAVYLLDTNAQPDVVKQHFLTMTKIA
jgi:adenylate kinase